MRLKGECGVSGWRISHTGISAFPPQLGCKFVEKNVSQGKSSIHLARSEFVKIVGAFIGTVMGGILAFPMIDYLVSPALKAEERDEWVSLGPVDDYPINVPTFFSFTRSRVNGWEKTVNSHGMYVLRNNIGTVSVYSDICTHLACKIKWYESRREYICPYHDGHFDIEGNVTKGPPPRPLDKFHTKLEDGNLSIHVEA